jgi:alkane 1-monooxygenase
MVLEWYIPVQIIGYLVAVVAFSTATSWVERFGIACTAGIVAGISTNPAHELGHRMEKVGKYLALLGLSQMGYGQFYVEHNRGHHRRVATPDDPASARYNESLWHFIVRSAVFSHASAIELESKRLRGRGKTFWSPSNALLVGWAMSATLWGIAFAVIGPAAIVFVVVQSFFGIYLVEAVNYLGHYGLARKKLDNGRYEPTNPNHSWNCNQWASNIFLFHLPRHSDHHENPLRPYHTVRDVPGYPTLPHGYPSMILIASVPPLWYRMMNPRLLALYDNDETLVNRGPVAG